MNSHMWLLEMILLIRIHDKNINLQHLIKWGSGTEYKQRILKKEKVKFNNSPENLHMMWQNMPLH